MTTLYFVTDIGIVSPCNGVIAGIFDNRQEAEELVQDIKSSGTYEKYGFWPEDQIGIVEKKMGRRQI